ncbi:MAG TPA: response regulator [Pyrinomonadaceae bacterium]|nr:response regulator [Pyrinomonadaceae bacterium]
MVTGRKLLLADDSVTIQKVIDLTFSDEGIEVTTVGNGEQALSKLDELQPDIVLADVFMPGRNGYEVCEHIKRDERYRHIPVMLLVGSFEPFDEAEARRVGADDYLTKPFQSIRQLVNKVTSLIGGGGADSEDETSTRDLELPEELRRKEGDHPEDAASDIYTADTAPLPKELEGRDPAEAAAHLAGHESLDDEMIEAHSPGRIAENFETGTPSQMLPTEPLSSADLAAAGIEAPTQQEPEQLKETTRDQSLDEMDEDILSTEQPQAENNFMTSAAAADEVLLDLGEIDTAPVSTREADDFILDLQDEAPAQAVAAVEPAPSVSGFAQPATLEPEPQPFEEMARPESFAGAEPALVESSAVEEAVGFGQQEAFQAQGGFEPQMMAGGFAGATEAVIDETPREAEASSASEASSSSFGVEASSPAPAASSSAEPAEQQQPTGRITLDQLSPEAIDAIARRAVEMLSERVVEQVAWEVVPQLAELLIKRKLEEEKTQ